MSERPRFRRRASGYGFRYPWAKASAIVAVALLGLGASSTIYPALAARADTLPAPQSVSAKGLPEDSLIYDRTGMVLLADLHPPGFQHYHQSLSQMGRWLPLAARLKIASPSNARGEVTS